MGKSIFFAYESGHQENGDAIKKAVREYNSYQKSFVAKTWEELGVCGRVINKTILDAINQCEIFACDLTYLNHNVLFELGYAIGKKKKLLIFLNDAVANATKQYSSFKLLKNIGYQVFSNHKNILTELQTRARIQTVLLSELINLPDIEQNTHDVFYISSKFETQASLELTDYFSSSKLKLIFDDTAEVEYQTLIWYINSLFRSKSIIIHLLGTHNTNSENYNAEHSLFAGIGCGLDKKVLLIAPRPFNAPIDYTDILIEYSSAEECVLLTDEWIERNSKEWIKDVKLESNVETKILGDDKKYNLLKLGIGCEIAEEEKEDLVNYFVEIEAYRKAFDKNLAILVGRKGSGKSAIFIKLENEYDKDLRNFNVILKPDSDELLENVELASLYSKEISRRHFYFSIWKFVILSRLFLTIEARIQKRILINPLSPFEADVLNFKNKHKELLSLNFFGAIKKINEMLQGKELSEYEGALNDLYKTYLSKIETLIRGYFKQSGKYIIINILADNLDKGWDSRNDLKIQSDMILALIEYSDKIAREIVAVDNEIKDTKINTILLLRKDIFNYILKRTREPDKLTVRSYEINWDKHPMLLRKLIEERFKFTLNIEDEKAVQDVWNEYFDLSSKGHPFDSIVKFVLPRPRDVIYFFGKLFESAVNNDHVKVVKDDLEYAVDAYASFLHNNMIAEVKAEFPMIEELLQEIHRKYGINNPPEYNKFKKLATSLGLTESDVERLLESLFSNQYLIGMREKSFSSLITNINDLNKKLKEKRFLFMRKNKVYLVFNPVEYLLRNKKTLVRMN